MARDNSKDLDFYNYILKTLEEQRAKPYLKNTDFMLELVEKLIKDLYKEFNKK